MVRELRVVGPDWMAEDLGGVHDRGFDAPTRPADYWCSGTHYARLHASGVGVSFSTPRGCLPLIGRAGREVRVLSVADLLKDMPGRTVFAKPNDLKLMSTFPAGLYEPARLAGRLGTVLASRLRDPAGLMVAISDPVVFEVEVRCFLLDGRVVLAHPYTDPLGGFGWGMPPLGPAETDEVVYAAERFAAGFDSPRAYVLDLGWSDGRWVPIETNPASSSGWYADNPPTNLADVIRAGQHDEAHHTWADPLEHLRVVALPAA